MDHFFGIGNRFEQASERAAGVMELAREGIAIPLEQGEVTDREFAGLPLVNREPNEAGFKGNIRNSLDTLIDFTGTPGANPSAERIIRYLSEGLFLIRLSTELEDVQRIRDRVGENTGLVCIFLGTYLIERELPTQEEKTFPDDEQTPNSHEESKQGIGSDQNDEDTDQQDTRRDEIPQECIRDRFKARCEALDLA